jgi:hypothetical protein
VTKYPIGIQDFEKLREGGYIYVDKTQEIYNLFHNGGGYYFLSRPRRFGKSMLTTTMKALFEGKKELFKGLYIEDKWNWEDTYPVIQISFANIDFVSKGLEVAILDEINFVARGLNLLITKKRLLLHSGN